MDDRGQGAAQPQLLPWAAYVYPHLTSSNATQHKAPPNAAQHHPWNASWPYWNCRWRWPLKLGTQAAELSCASTPSLDATGSCWMLVVIDCRWMSLDVVRCCFSPSFARDRTASLPCIFWHQPVLGTRDGTGVECSASDNSPDWRWRQGTSVVSWFVVVYLSPMAVKCYDVCSSPFTGMCACNGFCL